MSKVKKEATKKDVLYALQFGGEKLLRTHDRDERRNNGIVYTLSKSGYPVKPSVAYSVTQDHHVVSCDDGLFPGHTQQYEWRGDE